MKGNAIKVLQGLLWFVCAFHIAVGAGLNLFPETAPLMAQLYGAEVDWTPAFSYILKPLGAFMFALGLICIAAARDPLKNRAIIYGFATLFAIRALQRLVSAQEISEIFGIGATRNMSNMIFFFAMAAALIVLDRLARQGAAGSCSASESAAAE